MTERFANVLARQAYRGAYFFARMWWFVRRPRTIGSVVALWCHDRLLLVRASYRRGYTLPGGFVRRGETAIDGAVREVFEELEIALPPNTLTLAWQGLTIFEHRRDVTTIWEAVLETPPAIHVDGRELVWAGWRTLAEARAMTLTPPVREYLADR